MVACQNGLKRIAKLAMRHECDLNAQNLAGNTALHFCFMYGFGDELSTYLLSKGADSSIKNKARLARSRLRFDVGRHALLHRSPRRAGHDDDASAGRG